jgi:tetratricopeptide (TPR) repeat protein
VCAAQTRSAAPAVDAGAELEQAERARRRGQARAALRQVEGLLEERPQDASAWALLVEILHQNSALAQARERGHEALARVRDSADKEARAALVRALAGVELELGQPHEALLLLESARGPERPSDERDLWVLGRAQWTAGQRERARASWREAADRVGAATWQLLLARARCERALGLLERASQTLVECDRLPGAEPRGEPEVLVELAEIYFEADGELEDARASARSPSRLLRSALELDPGNARALLGLFRLHRHNWNRQKKPAQAWLEELLAQHPDGVPGLLAAAGADLDDGQLLSLRSRLARLNALAPARREVRALGSALAWVEHRRDEALAALAALAEEDPLDATPEREVGRHLCELYRFAEGREFLERAVLRDGADYQAWTELGRARANSGDERAALEALRTAEERAGGRQNAWRHNTKLVLERMQRVFVRESASGELTFAWIPELAPVLSAYQPEFYRRAREELAARYAFTPGPVQIQVFERFQDFSVRSTGFEGFPALGVCFGPVVTAVSPGSELRGKFNWQRTAFHEFTHVIHLGLSHNRCPRWITEGLATWEETRKNPSWTRNMRRDLLDSFHNGELIAVRELNRAFRGPRILFGYYQGGLLCEMLIEDHGFSSMVRLLEAFDRGADLDQALQEVFGATPEQIDRRFQARVERLVAPLSLEPRWSPAALLRARAAFRGPPPAGAPERARWVEAGLRVAWGEWQAGAKIDAAEALRRLAAVDPEPARAHGLRGHMALGEGQRERALEHFERARAAGGADFAASLALAAAAREAGRSAEALEHLREAEAAFPGYPDSQSAPELVTAQVLLELGREAQAQAARERWLAYDSDAYALRYELALYRAGQGDHAQAARWFEESNAIDPFRRALHERWAESLLELGRFEEALREARVGPLVPESIDQDELGPVQPRERARFLALEVRALEGLERQDEARSRLAEALELDPNLEALQELARRLGP